MSYLLDRYVVSDHVTIMWLSYDHIQLRDWNEEFQSTRDLPVDTIQQRMYRDRGLFKVHSDFIQSAVKGAMAAVDGQLHPLNPADPERCAI